MKKRVAHMLRNEQGVSILLALLAFFVCAMIATVIIAAAATTVKQNHDEISNQQGQIALQCAGKLISQEMTDTKYVETEVTKTTSGSSSTTTKGGSGHFLSMVTNAISNIGAGTYSGSFTVTPNIESANSGTSKQGINVDVDYKVAKASDGGYQINFTLKYPSGSSAVSQYLYLRVVGNPPVTNTTSDGATTTKTSTYSWNDGVFGTIEESES